jgi:hypothetical protein
MSPNRLLQLRTLSIHLQRKRNLLFLKGFPIGSRRLPPKRTVRLKSLRILVRVGSGTTRHRRLRNALKLLIRCLKFKWNSRKAQLKHQPRPHKLVLVGTKLQQKRHLNRMQATPSHECIPLEGRQPNNIPSHSPFHILKIPIHTKFSLSTNRCSTNHSGMTTLCKRSSLSTRKQSIRTRTSEERR